MIFMKKLFLLGFSLATFAISLNNSSKTSSINKTRRNNTNPLKDSQNVKDFKMYHSKIRFKNLVTRCSKDNSSEDLIDFQKLIGRFVTEMLTYTLKEENIFLLYDEEVSNHFTWVEFLLYQNLKNKTYISQTIQEFDISNYDAEIVSGYKYTTICVIYNNDILSDLFLNKTIDYKWAPAKLFIIFLDHQTPISDEIFDTTIQRSKYILIAELITKKEKLTFQMYSIYPFQINKTSFSQWKIFRGIYNFPRKINEILVERIFVSERVLHLASICDDSPRLYLDESGKCIGVNIEIFQIISKSLNFTYTVQFATEDGYWAGIENETFTGMLRDLYHNGKDLIINFYIFDYKEQSYIDLSIPYFYEGMGFLCRSPELSPVWQKLFLPFSTLLWILLLITIIVLIAITFCMMKISFQNENYSTFSTSILLVIGIMFRQDVNVTNKTISVLFLFSVWTIVAFIIMSAYSGNLISFMTFPRSKKPIETVKELINSNLRVATLNYGETVRQDFLTSPTEDLRILGKKLDYFPNTGLGYKRAIESVINNHHVFIDVHTFLFYAQKELNIIEQTYVLKEQVFQGYKSFVFKKHSPLTYPISYKLNRLTETGIYSGILEKYLNNIKSHRRGNEQSDERQKLQLKHVQTAFFGLFLGYLIALVILLWEIIMNSH